MYRNHLFFVASRNKDYVLTKQVMMSCTFKNVKFSLEKDCFITASRKLFTVKIRNTPTKTSFKHSNSPEKIPLQNSPRNEISWKYSIIYK